MSAVQRPANRRRLITAVVAASVLALAACTSTDSSGDGGSSGAASNPTAGTASSLQSGTAEIAAPGPGGRAGAGSPTPSISIPAPATTPVPAPGGGNISETVSVGPITSNSPVPLSDASKNSSGVSVALSGIERVTTEANLPGEIAGPGLKVTVKISNGSSEPVDVGNVVVNLQDAKGRPAIPITTGGTPFTGSLAAGSDGTSVYVFTSPKPYTDPATVTVTYSAVEPVAVFVGNVR